MSGQNGHATGHPTGYDGEPTSIGQRLARAREAAELSVAEVSALTRIREPVIHAIERDDFSITGGDFYSRGHVRNIAKVVGLDTETIVHDYDDQHGGTTLPVRASEVFQAEIPIKLRERRTFNWTTAMALILLAVVVFGAVRMMGGSGSMQSVGLRQGQSGGSLAEKKPQASKTPSHKAAGAKPAAPQASRMVVVQITAETASFVNVRDAKGRRLFQGRLAAGNTSTWKAQDKVEVTISNAGGVRLEVNGKDLGVPGRYGERIHRVFGPGAPTPGVR